jgi:hypothetical protein
MSWLKKLNDGPLTAIWVAVCLVGAGVGMFILATSFEHDPAGLKSAKEVKPQTVIIVVRPCGETSSPRVEPGPDRRADHWTMRT